MIISEQGEIMIPALYVETVVDATGCGDAFRAGLLYGFLAGWDMPKSATLGSILGGIKIGYMGGQNHTFTKELIKNIGKQQFDESFFA